jgi:hypothetical protein
MSHKQLSSAEKEEFLKEILKAWLEFPQMRFCQLLVNSARRDDIFYVADDELLELMSLFVAKFGGTQF